jgi:5-amino-6-(5-phospho-D-ribitylamino)uracil phosphatase
MNISFQRISSGDAAVWLKLQIEAFTPLLVKYQDYEISPAMETIEYVATRMEAPCRDHYLILRDGEVVGGVRTFWWDGTTRYRIGGIFILPRFQSMGIGRIAMKEVEALYPNAISWELDTLLQEPRNLHFYESLGYQRRGDERIINDRLSLVSYTKAISKPMRLMVTDLDRTLLRNDKSISTYTKTILDRCRESGIRVVFATARPLRGVNRYVAYIPDAVICHNGATTYIGNDLFCSYGISAPVRDSVIQLILSAMRAPEIAIEIHEKIYANWNTEIEWPGVTAFATDFFRLPVYAADKIIIRMPDVSVLEQIESLLPADLYIQMNEGRLALIMHRSASKWDAIRCLAEHWGISAPEIVAFGDDNNDIVMLQNCGTGISVVNALDDVIATADAVCGSNDSDGVAHWLEANVLQTAGYR